MKYLKRLVCLAFGILLISVASTVMAKDIVIGFSGPMSGPAAEYGTDCVNGIDMAVKELNAAGGITVKGQKYMFKLGKLDDRTDPTQAINNARRLRDQDKAIAIYNPVFTTLTGIMKINQEKGNEFLVMAYTSVPQITLMNNKLLVVTTLSMNVYTQIFIDKAWKMGYRKIAMLVTLGGYGDVWRKAFKEGWEKKGGKITEDKPANYYKETDYSSQLTAVMATKPDALLIGGPSATTALVIEQARNLGFKGGFIMIDQARSDNIAKMLKSTKLLDDVLGIAAVADMPIPGAKIFDKKYVAAYGRMTTWEAVLHYASMHALAKAIVASGNAESPAAIRAAFPKVFPILGDNFPAEMFGIHNNGQFQILGAVQTVKDGKFGTPELNVWWTKSQAAFNQVKKQTKYTVPVLWFKFKE